MSSPHESPRDSRRRRIAHFKNNWGTSIKQVDEEDSDDVDSRPVTRSPISSRRSSASSLGSPGTSSCYSPPILAPRLERIRHISSSSAVGDSTSIFQPLASPTWLTSLTRSPSGLSHGSNSPVADSNGYSSNAACGCKREKNNLIVCDCNEGDDKTFDWQWDDTSKSTGVQLNDLKRDVYFHSQYSCGTAAIRGDKPLESDQFFWEIKLLSPCYGTSMMIGAGSESVQLDRLVSTFGSLLGEDRDSCGLSYTGLFRYNNEEKCYSPRFNQGTIIGVWLDMFFGRISYYRNHQPLGVISHSLHGRAPLYPIISSTAARSGMRLVRSKCFKSSLQFFCCVQLRKSIPLDRHVLEEVHLPPGLDRHLRTQLDWLLRPNFPARQLATSSSKTASTTNATTSTTARTPTKRTFTLADDSATYSESTCKKLKETI